MARLASALIVLLVVLPTSFVYSGVAGAMNLKQLAVTELPGWHKDDHREGLAVFSSSCSEIMRQGRGFSRAARLSGSRSDWIELCRIAAEFRPLQSPGAARDFFEAHTVAIELAGVPGKFTGYFEPVLEGSLQMTDEYPVPVLSRPGDLVRFSKAQERVAGVEYGRLDGNNPKPYWSRREIEEGKLQGRGLELLFLKSWSDLFFMQVQGSGRVRLRDGSLVSLAYAAKSGRAYTSIGKILVDRGDIARQDMSMKAIRDWLDANPELARELLWQNQSYVFFRRRPDLPAETGPEGAQGLPLTRFRSLAADRSYWALGVPVWVSTTRHSATGLEVFQRMMIVQDTGSAIRGAARGDIYFGSGDAAGRFAGEMDQPGSMYAIVPKYLAAKLIRTFAN